MKPHVEEIRDNRGLLHLATIVRSEFQEDGVSFLTHENYSQQLAFIKQPKGKIIEAHIHSSVPRAIATTQEVLLVREGKIKVYLFDADMQCVTDRVLGPGDVLLLIAGGHGFEVLADCEMWEVKQGPYCGPRADKVVFYGKIPRAGA